jgi:hypothetical protein
MADAGTVEHHPLRFGHGPLIADGKRHDDAGVRRVAKGRFNALTHAFAFALDIVAEASGERVHARVALVLHDVAGRVQALLQQPRFEVESAGIHVAVRTLEADGQRPSLTGSHHRHDLVAAARVPREGDA